MKHMYVTCGRLMLRVNQSIFLVLGKERAANINLRTCMSYHYSLNETVFKSFVIIM